MNAAAHTFQINQLLNNSMVPHKFYKNDLDFEPCDLFALVNFFFFEISILVTKNQYHPSIIASPLSVPQESKLALMTTRLNLSSAFRATPEKTLWLVSHLLS